MQFKIAGLTSIIFSTLFSFNALGVENTLCEITSDLDSDTGKIVYEMDEDNRGIKHLYEDQYHNDKISKRIELQAEELKDGIVLNKKDKNIIVRIQSDNFDPERGGLLYLDTLYSGVNGDRKGYSMELEMDPSGPQLMNNKQVFHKMKFIAKRSKLLGVIGIEKVQFEN